MGDGAGHNRHIVGAGACREYEEGGSKGEQRHRIYQCAPGEKQSEL